MTRDAKLWAPPNTMWCECGNRKLSTVVACKRCSYLDGNRRGADVIEVLRGTDGLSLPDVCELVYGDDSHSNRVSMLRVLMAMVRSGRLRRFWQDAERGQWVYVLDGKTEREWRAA